jgi:TRAP-type C4-dicarboxylate transport system substrate-binding protein
VQIYSQRFHEVQKYLSLSNHVYTPAFVLAGASWKRLPEDVREVLSEAAQEAEAFALEQGAALDASLVQKMEEAGMEVNKVDQQAFIDGSKAIYAKFAAEVDGGQAMLDKVEQLRQM